MNQLVLDSSVIIKWFSSDKEEHFETAKNLFLAAVERRIEIYVPELLIYEISNVLLKSKKLAPEEIKKSISHLRKLNLHIITLNRQLEQRMIEYAGKFNLTSYDAVYLALSDMLQINLISCDKDLLLTKSKRVIHLSQVQK